MTSVPDIAAAAREMAAGCEEPVAVISDVHLQRGTDWRGRFEALRPIWLGARTAVFNGDTVDWGLARRPRRLARVMEFLPEVCRRDGVRPVFLAGNADPGISPARHVVLGGGKVLVTHGDVLFPAISLWRPHSGWIRRYREDALARLPEAQRQTLEGQLLATAQTVVAIHAEHARKIRSRWQRRLKRIKLLAQRAAGAAAVLTAWRRTPSMAAAFMRRYAPDQPFLIIGHTHHPGIWTRRERTVINTGGFARLGHPWMVWIERGRLVVRRIRLEGRGCSPGKVVRELSLEDAR
ncbi:MAG: metallophosphoesterase [Phycisphaerae bacterium]